MQVLKIPWLHSALFLTLGGLLAACHQPAEPIAMHNPEIRRLEINETALRHGGVLLVRAVPVDPGVLDTPNIRIPITVHAGSGESVELIAEPEVCIVPEGSGYVAPDGTDRTGEEYICSEFSVGLESPSDTARLQPYVNAINARMQIHTRKLDDGSIRIIEPAVANVRIFSGNIFETIRKAKKWPGIRWVELSGFLYIQGGSEPSFAGTAPLDFNASSDGGSGIRVNPGDTITVSYRQPDGTSLKVKATL